MEIENDGKIFFLFKTFHVTITGVLANICLGNKRDNSTSLSVASESIPDIMITDSIIATIR